MLSKPTSLYIYESQFKGSGLYWEENSPEDIEFSVIEMLERIDQTENKLNNYPLTKEQLEFKKILQNVDFFDFPKEALTFSFLNIC